MTNDKSSSLVIGLWLFVLLLSLTGCAGRPDVVQARHREPAGEIWGSHTVGQTFVAARPGLYRVDVFLATYARQNSGQVIFHLRRSPESHQDLVTIPFDAAEVQDNAYRSFSFPPLADSQDQSYYFFLESPVAQPGNAITVWYNPSDVYGEGMAILGDVPQVGDLDFRTYSQYAPSQMLYDVAQGLRGHLTTALLALLLFLVPGYALLNLLAPPGAADPAARLILGAGLSVALAPLLLLFASLVGLKLGAGPVLLFLTLSAGLIPLMILRSRITPDFGLPVRRTDGRISDCGLCSEIRNQKSEIPNPIPLLLLAVLAVSLAVRLLAVQNLPAPMWGDSYHHTLIVQLMADHGGLFTSWEPYAPLRTFTYHFGFHSNVALFHWLTGTPVLRSVIVVGQILNALAPLTIYPLVRRLGGSAWAGTIAVLIASLLSPMPSGYVNWGRYTQLTGMLVLPVAATLTIDAISNKKRMWRWLVLAGIAVAGLILSHYLVTLIFLPLLAAYLVWWTGIHIRRERGNPLALIEPWLQAGAIGLIAGVIIIPWILNLWSGRLPQVLASRFDNSPETTFFRTTHNAVGDLLAYAPLWLIALAAVGALWGRRRGQPLFPVTAAWIVLLVLIANPNIAGLPGAGVLNNFAMLLALYLPLSVLAGAGLAQAIDLTVERFPYVRLVATGLVIVAALAGAPARLMDVDYRYRLVTSADLEAVQWIREHTPASAKFLVNSITFYGGHAVLGDDAGWWIPYLAERRTMVPPAVYTMEQPENPEYVAQVLDFYQQVTKHPLDSPQTLQLLMSEGVTHVYVGAVGGELLDPRVLEGSPYYRTVYHQDGVWIFEVNANSGT